MPRSRSAEASRVAGGWLLPLWTVLLQVHCGGGEGGGRAGGHVQEAPSPAPAQPHSLRVPGSGQFIVGLQRPLTLMAGRGEDLSGGVVRQGAPDFFLTREDTDLCL